MKKSIRALKSWLFTPGNKAEQFSRAEVLLDGDRIFRHSYDFAMSSYILRNRLRIIGG